VRLHLANSKCMFTLTGGGNDVIQQADVSAAF